MIYWIPIYSSTGRRWNSNADRLDSKQFSEMDYIFRSACQGLNSPDINKIYEQHRRKSLFYHLSGHTGLRYHMEINKRRGTVVILSVEADNTRISSPAKGRRGRAAA
ncbi:MAG: hypothetical protein ACI4D3_02945 [Lachnospiraceae bacterium]